MAKLEIAEFDVVHAWGLLSVPQVVQPGIEIGVASAQSAAFLHPIVQFTPRADCRIEFGVDPTATAASEFFAANIPVTRLLTVGHKLAEINA